MKKFFLSTLLIIFCTLIFAGCGNPDEKSKIIIGLDDEFAPMTFRDENGEIVGFDVDLAKETARRMDVDAEFKPIDWNDKEREITSGSVDIIWSGLDITDDRKEYMVFTKPYMEDRQIILVRKDSDFRIHSEYDLEGKIVGTQDGSDSEDYIEQNLNLKNSLREFKTFSSYVNAFAALESGEIEALIVNEISGRYEISKHADKFKTVEVTVGPVQGIGVGFKKDNVKLRDEVQKNFDEMIADGTAKKISMQWFGADLIKSRR